MPNTVNSISPAHKGATLLCDKSIADHLDGVKQKYTATKKVTLCQTSENSISRLTKERSYFDKSIANHLDGVKQKNNLPAIGGRRR